ncbi:hypothetical protein [Stackebrandtia nassauensis]|uniref:hypothetical protein n=1 Tax=Stackebrandtia nassauensis TaxID=283811 RepID=UPI0001A3AA30|nr:hypothetical protein [Stackebrandtia nassauensis]
MNTAGIYTYFVVYVNDGGRGVSEMSLGKPITTFEQIRQIARVIEADNGITGVTVTWYQLLSGPEANNRLEDALRDVHNFLSRALDNAAADRRSGFYSQKSILDTLTGNVREARATLGALTDQ